MWKDYIKKTERRKPLPFVVASVKRYAPKRGRTLDIGSGAGVEAKFLKKEGYSVVALDNDAYAIQKLKQRGIKTVKSDIRNFKIKPKR